MSAEPLNITWCKTGTGTFNGDRTFGTRGLEKSKQQDDEDGNDAETRPGPSAVIATSVVAKALEMAETSIISGEVIVRDALVVFDPTLLARIKSEVFVFVLSLLARFINLHPSDQDNS
jgi:hypothetical protein